MKRMDYVSLFPLTTKRQARKERGTGIAAGVAAGALIGAAAGILLAPKSGKETRADIKEKTGEVASVVKEKGGEVASTVKEKTVEYAGVVKDKAKDAYQTVKDKLSKKDGNDTEEDIEE